jgi:hypothetical protein
LGDLAEAAGVDDDLSIVSMTSSISRGEELLETIYHLNKGSQMRWHSKSTSVEDIDSIFHTLDQIAQQKC